MRIVVASTLAVLAASTAAWGQPHRGLTECGARPAMRYAAVFDASSSLRDEPALRAETEASYRKLLGLFTGLLCREDRLAVYTFPPDSTTRMHPLVEITHSSRTSSLLSVTAQRVIESRPGHTDLHLVSRGILRDVIPENEPHAIFVVTDGSFYPHSPKPHDRTLTGVHTRLTDLKYFVSDTLRPARSEVFVIGVNAANSYAVDRQLKADLTGTAEQRRWNDVDVLEDHGEDLLREVFGPQYVALPAFSLWDVLVAGRRSLWARRLGYLTDDDLPWSELSTLSVQHLVYVPGGPGGSTSCTLPSAAGMQVLAEEAEYAAAGEVLCSLENPTPAQISAIHRSSRFYAFRQGASLRPVAGIEHVRGLHDVLLRDSANECSVGSVRSHFGRGEKWPPPNSPPVGHARVSPVDKIRWSEPIDLIRLGGAGCVVPRFTSGVWPFSPGDYFVKVVHDKTSVFRVTVDSARGRVTEAFIRPGGLPLPADRIALVRVCVRTDPALPGHQRMWMHLGDKFLPLTLERGSRCSGADANVAAFSGLVGLEHTDVGSADVFVVGADAMPEHPRSGEWLPVVLKRDRRMLLPWLHLGLVFALGMAVQLVYACVRNRPRRVTALPPISTLLGAVVSGVIVSVIAEFAAMISETDVASDRIPVVLGLSVLAHMLTLLAAALMPEYMEEFLLNS